MAALTILIIRHAEKPGENWPGHGLSAEGQPDRKSLVIRGWQRAGAWTALFGCGLGGADYPKPDAIYAAQPDPYDGPLAAEGDPSQRPYETVRSLADRLQLKPIIRWAKGEETGLAAEITLQHGVVLVCWEHKLITDALIPHLLAGQPVADVPTHWDGQRYDVVLRFDRAGDGAPWSFRQLFPRLLAGDSDAPLR